MRHAARQAVGAGLWLVASWGVTAFADVAHAFRSLRVRVVVARDETALYPTPVVPYSYPILPSPGDEVLLEIMPAEEWAELERNARV